MSDDFYSRILADARKLEGGLGLPEGFLDALKAEDDWSFVIKAHALLEAALTHALVVRTGLDAAEEFFSHLELSGSKTGKVALAESLDMLRSEERRFIRSFSELRNVFVHDVKNVHATLRSYFAAASKDKRKIWARSFCSFDLDRTLTDSEVMQRLETEPKQAMWSATLYTLAILQIQVDTDRGERELTTYQVEFAKYRDVMAKLSRVRDAKP